MNNFQLLNLRKLGKHFVSGSPVSPLLHVQIGLWLMTEQSVFCPHAWTHGFIHFLFTQALLEGHSELITHSGRHEGGVPLYSGRQEQTTLFELTRHWLFGPQGFGSHGFVWSSSINENNKLCNIS